MYCILLICSFVNKELFVNIDFLQGQSLFDAYAETDIVVMPSRYEPFGLTGLEAMASGCLLLVTEGLGMDEYAKPGKNCFSIPSYGALASGYGTTASATEHSVVPVGYVPGKGWLPGYGPSSTPKTDEKDENDSNSGDNTPSGDTNTKPVNPLGEGCNITGAYADLYCANDDNYEDLHTGVDMTSTTREVSSVKSGTVMFAGKHPDGTGTTTGTLVIIKYDDGNYGLYVHMDPNDLNGLKAGQSVSSGSSLGKYYDGVMGKSSGGHLHYSEFSSSTTATGDALARLFNRTGYFYGDDGNSHITDPTGQELWNGFTVVNPGF